LKFESLVLLVLSGPVQPVVQEMQRQVFTASRNILITFSTLLMDIIFTS